MIVRKGEAEPSIMEASVSLPFPSVPSEARMSALIQEPHLIDCTKPLGPAFFSRPQDSGDYCKPKTKFLGVTVTLPPAESETIGYVALKKTVTPQQLSRLMSEECGNIVILPVGIDTNLECGVVISFLDSIEDFRHDALLGGWVGNGGSFLAGGADLFCEMIGWCLTITVRENRPPSVELRNGGQCVAVTLNSFPIAIETQTSVVGSLQSDPADAQEKNLVSGPDLVQAIPG